MDFIFIKTLISKAFLCLMFLHFTHLSLGQSLDTTQQIIHFRSMLSATNNGFSLVPTFSLGKPAVVTTFNISGKGRFSFEPEFRYSMEFKPWSFIFIWRYKLIEKNKFQLKLGTHLPALNFISGSVIKNGMEQEAIQARRFFPVIEVIPSYKVSTNISLGLYYLYSIGMEKELTKNNHFVSLQPNFNNIPLTKQFYMRFNPQFYYLKLDKQDGFYVASSLTLARENFPFSISTLMNKAIDSDIPAKDFDWNVSLNYTFGKDYIKK
ncbi:MAG: hypothetical protein IPJ74_07825 [Saprospiraceae bacterium]|nr:hypothetical protein [Saprospiraceae bacterium]